MKSSQDDSIVKRVESILEHSKTDPSFGKKLQEANMKRNSVIADFDVLIDMDLAIASYLIEQYPKSFYFKDKLADTSMYFLKLLLLSRKDRNPITAIVKDEYKDKVDDIYKEITTNTEIYDKILDIAAAFPTDILGILSLSSKNFGYRITVRCRNIQEENTFLNIVRLDNGAKWNTIVDNSEKLSIDKYKILFIHDIDEIGDFEEVGGKTIYLYDYGGNYEDFKHNKYSLTAILAGSINAVKFISPYSNFVFPKEIRDPLSKEDFK